MLRPYSFPISISVYPRKKYIIEPYDAVPIILIVRRLIACFNDNFLTFRNKTCRFVLVKVMVCRERLKGRFGHQMVKRYIMLLFTPKIAVCVACCITKNDFAKGVESILDMLHELFRIPHFFTTPFLPSRGLLQQTSMQIRPHEHLSNTNYQDISNE